MSAFIHKVFKPSSSSSSYSSSSCSYSSSSSTTSHPPPTPPHSSSSTTPTAASLPAPNTPITTPTSTPTPTTTTTTATTLQPLTVLELFQSQGCNSCPRANAAVLARASRQLAAELLLTYEVTYWDHLGWADTLGDRRWDARQSAYARTLGQRSCYTPQVIIDGGARPLLGTGWRGLGAVLDAAAVEVPRPSRFTFSLVEGGRGIAIAGGAGRALVLVVEFEPLPEPVRILRGENRGVTESYRNVVRDLKVVGLWEGGELVVELPVRRTGLEMAVLVQAENGGQILGAVRV